MNRVFCTTFFLLASLSPVLSKADGKLQFGFIENKGQVTDQYNKPNAAVNYLLNNKGLNVQLRDGGFSYDAYVLEENDAAAKLAAYSCQYNKEIDVTYKFHRVDIELVGANKHAAIITGEATGDVINYYLGGVETINVHHYRKVTYKDIYPGIDLEFTTAQEANSMEYNFIVHPGADPSQIQLRYNGMHNIALVNNRLQITVAHGDIAEKIPASFIAATHAPVAVNYRQTGEHTFGFSVASYDKTQTLVIDPKPDIAWATYYGGSGVDEANSVKVSSSSVYMAGSSFSSNNIASSGAFQSTLHTGCDAFVAKFNFAGTRQWATYYGSAGTDIAYSITALPSGTSVVTGSTTSDTGFATNGAYQTTITGTFSDAFVASFNGSGQRQWCTYFGGDQAEIGYGVALDGSGNIYISGSTESMMGISSTGTAQEMTGGLRDAFLARFSGSGNFDWATYAGEIDNEDGYGVATDGSGNVFLAGVVHNGMGGDLVTSGAHQTSFGGDTTDYFLGKYKASDGTRYWGTYYGGSGGEYAERGNKIATDGSGNVYLVGATYSTSGIATTGSFQDNLMNNTKDAFIAKFNGSGVRQWATYYGTNSEESLTGITVGASGDIYAVGFTNSSTGLATNDAVKTGSGGNIDLFVASFNSAGSRQWATYFGNNGDEMAYSIAVDADEHIYVCGSTSSTNSLATTGAHQGTFGGGATDAFLTRLNACKTNNLTASHVSTMAGCFGQSNGGITISSSNGLAPYMYELNTAPGFQTSPTFSNLSAGAYEVTVKDANSCEIIVKDTIKEYPQIQPVTIIGPDNAKAFFTQSYSVSPVQAGIMYEWFIPSGNGTFPSGNQGSPITVLWGNTGTGDGILKVKAISGPGCEDTFSYTVTITPSSVNDVTGASMDIYPNPVTEKVTIKLQYVPVNNEVLRIYNSMGKLMLQQELKQQQTIDMAAFPAGIYYLQAGEVQRKLSKL